MARAPQPAHSSMLYSPRSAHPSGLSSTRSDAAATSGYLVPSSPLSSRSPRSWFPVSSPPSQDLFKPRRRSRLRPHSTRRAYLLPAEVEAPHWLPTQYYPGYVLALSQVKKYGLPLPVWTTPQRAVGQVDVGDLGQLVAIPNTTVTASLPVMRAELEECAPLIHGKNFTLLPSNKISLNPAPSTVNELGWFMCASTRFYNPSYPYGDNITLPMSQEPGWFGVMYHQSCGGYIRVAAFGNTNAQNASSIAELTVVQCSNYSLKQSTQDVTLAYTDQIVNILSIDLEARDTIVMDSFPSEETGFLSDEVSTLPAGMFDNNASHAFDTFMQLLILQNTSIPLDTFLNATVLTRATQELYETYWAIYATRNLVIPANASGSKMVDAVVNFPCTRIVQERTPTRILQALLGTLLIRITGVTYENFRIPSQAIRGRPRDPAETFRMNFWTPVTYEIFSYKSGVLGFGLLTALVGHGKSPLAKPPYPIGAGMALLAGSRLVELPELRRLNIVDKISSFPEFQFWDVRVLTRALVIGPYGRLWRRRGMGSDEEHEIGPLGASCQWAISRSTEPALTMPGSASGG
ncbi:hypothetical protein GGX14DRAFT_387285 [Mycena pura]|uniref:Uncharacterized protein n=1 Tax=Mycena pura TaxID=153505 RepID=A0AAD6YNN0_9AGAR|nr:hypothetical protein GGX14DRAFT_387285 [Mycena pura]